MKALQIWNKWFKTYDSDKQADLALFPTWRPSPFPGDGNGDDLIQIVEQSGSFTYSESVAELGGQPGWEGSVFLNAPAGDYIVWSIHPSGGIDACDRLTAYGIGISVP